MYPTKESVFSYSAMFCCTFEILEIVKHYKSNNITRTWACIQIYSSSEQLSQLSEKKEKLVGIDLEHIGLPLWNISTHTVLILAKMDTEIPHFQIRTFARNLLCSMGILTEAPSFSVRVTWNLQYESFSVRIDCM